VLLGQLPKSSPKRKGAASLKLLYYDIVASFCDIHFVKLLVFKQLLELGIKLDHQGMSPIHRTLVVCIAHELQRGLDSLDGFCSRFSSSALSRRNIRGFAVSSQKF